MKPGRSLFSLQPFAFTSFNSVVIGAAALYSTALMEYLEEVEPDGSGRFAQHRMAFHGGFVIWFLLAVAAIIALRFPTRIVNLCLHFLCFCAVTLAMCFLSQF